MRLDLSGHRLVWMSWRGSHQRGWRYVFSGKGAVLQHSTARQRIRQQLRYLAQHIAGMPNAFPIAPPVRLQRLVLCDCCQV